MGLEQAPENLGGGRHWLSAFERREGAGFLVKVDS